MYKKLLLASSLVASAVAMQAEEYYIVKDGKVAEGVELLDAAEGSKLKITEGVEVAGGTGTYLHYKTEETALAVYGSRMFYVKDGIDLNNVWMIDITYIFPEGSTIHGDNLKRESMRIDLLGDTVTVAGVDTFKYDYNQTSRRFAHLGYDVYFRDFYKYNPAEDVAELKNQGVGMDRTLTRYIYTNPSFKDVLGSSNKVNVVSLACGQEAPSTAEFPNEFYIKEIKIYSEGIKPFYNEPFHSFVDAAYISGPGTNFFRYKDTDGTLVPYNTKKNMGYEAAELYGCTYAAGTQLNGLKAGNLAANCERLWQSKGEQCVDDIFYDTEVGIMLGVGSAADRAKNPVYVRIPFDDMVAKAGEKMNVHLMFGHNACGSCNQYPSYDKAASVAPLQYRFEKGDLSSYSEAKDWTVYSSIDTLPININIIEEDITVPEGGYNIITLGFFPQEDVSYVVGDLQVRGARSVIPTKFAEFAGETVDVCKISMPFSNFIDGVETIESDGLEIYPNPAESEFFVPADVVKVEVISMAGNVVLTTNSNAVNVKGLAKGMYAVKAYTESGVKTARIIKK